MAPWNAAAHSASDRTLVAVFVSNGLKAQCKPDPRYPDGLAVDISQGERSCSTALPCPAESCGYWRLECAICGLKVVVTAAGRPDDPRFVRVGCKLGARA